MIAPKIITKASSVNIHPGAHLGMGIETERKPANLDMLQVCTHPMPERLENLLEH